MSIHLFFSKTDKRLRTSFFSSGEAHATGESTRESGRDSNSLATFFINDQGKNVSHRKLRFLRPKKSLEDMLEKLLRSAEATGFEARENILKQLVIFLQKNPQLVNRVPNKFHSNPLELVILIGSTEIIKELLTLKAQVRPQNRILLSKINYLLNTCSINKKPKIHKYIRNDRCF